MFDSVVIVGTRGKKTIQFILLFKGKLIVNCICLTIYSVIKQ